MTESKWKYESGEQKEVFLFLDRLRESGIINMFVAPSHVMEEFPHLSGFETQAYVSEWIWTFGDRVAAGEVAGFLERI